MLRKSFKNRPGNTLTDRLKNFCLCLCFLFAGIGYTYAEPPLLQQAIKLYFDNKIDSARDLFVALAKQNDAEAFYYLGLIDSDKQYQYFNTKSAMAYLLSAADLNHAQAMQKLGSMYDNGVGVKQDALIALDWYRKAKQAEKTVAGDAVFLEQKGDALEKTTYPKIFSQLLSQAEAGSVEAQYQIAVNYDNGSLIPRDFTKALQWYQRAANNSHKESQFLMGYFYCRGLGVAKDPIIANQWLKKSGRMAACAQQ